MAIAGVGTRSTETRARKPRELSDLSATLTALKPKTVLLAQNGDIQGMEYLSAEQLAEIIVDKNSSLKRRDAACSQMEELGLDQVSEATLQRIMRQGQQR